MSAAIKFQPIDPTLFILGGLVIIGGYFLIKRLPGLAVEAVQAAPGVIMEGINDAGENIVKRPLIAELAVHCYTRAIESPEGYPDGLPWYCPSP